MYLTVSYIATPNDNVCPSKKDFWAHDDNFHFEEQVHLTKHLRDSDLKRCDVILDLKKEEVVKLRSGDRNYAKIYEYFEEHYKNYIEAFKAKAV